MIKRRSGPPGFAVEASFAAQASRPVRPEVEPQPALDLVKCPAVGCGGTMPISSLVCGRCWTLLPPRTQQALSTTATFTRVHATIRFRRLLAQGKKPEEIWL